VGRKSSATRQGGLVRTARIIGVAIVLPLLCAGCGAKPAPVAESEISADIKNPTELSQSTIQQGYALYHAADCVVCHGRLGDGKGFDAKNGHMNVHDWRNAEYIKNFTDAKLYAILAKGKDVMPAYEKHNTPDQLWFMVDYIRSLSMK
jgi:mono/diheme cytochrome c family protein